jgi:hypothetical protein
MWILSGARSADSTEEQAPSNISESAPEIMRPKFPRPCLLLGRGHPEFQSTRASIQSSLLSFV